MNFVKELEWRGMINNMMPGTEEQLEKELTSAYLGIDPTADSLHIPTAISASTSLRMPLSRAPTRWR